MCTVCDSRLCVYLTSLDNAGSKPSATEARYSIDIDQSESQSVAQTPLDAVHRLRFILCFLIFCLHLAEMEVVATG